MELKEKIEKLQNIIKEKRPTSSISFYYFPQVDTWRGILAVNDVNTRLESNTFEELVDLLTEYGA